MATQPSDELIGLIKNQNRRRNSDWMRSLGAIAPTAAAFGQSPAQAQAVAQSFFPDYAKSQNPVSSKMDVNEMKLKIIDKMSKAEADQRGDEMKSLGDMFKDGQDLMKEVIALAGTAYGAQSSAQATVASSVNRESANIGNTLSGAVMKVAETTNLANKAGVSAAIQTVRDAMQGVGLQDARSMEVLRDQMSNLINMGDMGGMAGAAVVMNMADAIATENGQPPARQFLQQHAQSDPGGPAAQIIAMTSDPSMVSALHENAKQAMFLVQADSAQRTADLIKGVPGMGKVAQFIEDTYSQLKDLQDPDERAKAFSDALEGLPSQQNPQSVAAFADLLGQIDTDTPPAANLAEARLRLFEEPAFKDWMKGNGFKDPKMALKELRRITEEKVQGDRESDRKLMAQRRQAGVEAGTGGPAPSEGAALVNTPAGTPRDTGSDEDPMFVRAPDGVIWFMGEDGVMRPASDEELEEIHFKLVDFEPGGQRDAAMAAMIAPASKFEAMKAKAKPVAAPAEKPTPKDDPTAVAGEGMPDGFSALKNTFKKRPEEGQDDPETVMMKPTIGGLTRDATSAVFHPVSTLKTGAELARERIDALLRKRKGGLPPEATEAP